MANLSAPTIKEPLYQCAARVVATGYVPGATISIFATLPGSGQTLKVGGGTSTSSSGQAFGVDPVSMVAGATITATQTFAGNTSPVSTGVTLQTPLSLNAPTLTAPLFECARCIRVDDLLPGATAQVRDSATTLGGDVLGKCSVLPVFQNESQITAKGLLGGAIVEVEEVSSYKQVIGKRAPRAASSRSP